MMTHETGRALIPYDPESIVWGPDYGVRYTMDEVDALKICRARFKETHRKYHLERRELAATVYAISLRLLQNEPAQVKLLSEPFFRDHPPGKFETPRDLFRVVWVYVTKEDPKLASKYSKVLWHLYDAKVHAEQAAEAIRRSGGIEKVARSGLYTPPYVDPRDVGDGMDAYGRKIWYPEEIKPKTVKPEPDEEEIRYHSEQRIFDFVGEAEADEGTVQVVMAYQKTARGPLLEVIEVEESDRRILPVLISDVQWREMQRVRLGKRARMNVRKVVRSDRSIQYRATVVRPLTPPQGGSGVPPADRQAGCRACTTFGLELKV